MSVPSFVAFHTLGLCNMGALQINGGSATAVGFTGASAAPIIIAISNDDTLGGIGVSGSSALLPTQSAIKEFVLNNASASTGPTGPMGSPGATGPGIDRSNQLFVDKSGSPSGTGSMNLPFVEIGQAINTIVDASDSNRYIVNVGNGVFAEDFDLIPWVTLKGTGPATTFLTATMTLATAGFTSFPWSRGDSLEAKTFVFADLSIAVPLALSFEGASSHFGRIVFDGCSFSAGVSLDGYVHLSLSGNSATFINCVSSSDLNVSSLSTYVSNSIECPCAHTDTIGFNQCNRSSAMR